MYDFAENLRVQFGFDNCGLPRPFSDHHGKLMIGIQLSNNGKRIAA